MGLGEGVGESPEPQPLGWGNFSVPFVTQQVPKLPSGWFGFFFSLFTYINEVSHHFESLQLATWGCLSEA